MSYFVRTGNDGYNADFFIRDLGITILTGQSWTELSSYNSSGFSTGQFSVEELAASKDLYDAIVAFQLQVSTDGLTNNVDGYSYSPIFPIVNEISQSPNGIDLTDSSLVLPNTLDAATLILSPSPGQIAFDTDDGYVVFYDGYEWKQVGEGAPSDVTNGAIYTGVQDFTGSELLIPHGSSLPAQPASQGRLFLLNDAGTMKLYASDGSEWDIIGPVFGGGGDSGLWYSDSGVVQLIDDGYILRVDEVQIGSASIEITEDGYGNMVFVDQSNPSGVTLSDLLAGSGFNPGYFDITDGYVLTPIDDGYILRVQEYQVEDERVKIYSDGGGNLLLEDVAGVTSLAALKSMRNIWLRLDGYTPGNITLSDNINWDAKYTYISSIKVETDSTNWDLWICESSEFNLSLPTSRRIVRRGLRDTIIDVGFEVNSDSTSLYLVYIDNAGNNAANFYITGEARRH